MKYMKSFLTWVLLLAATHVMALTVTVDDVQFKPGGTAEIVVNLANTETTLSGYQMSLYLPAGITLQTDDDDDYIYTLSGRHKSDHQMTIKVDQKANDGSLLLVCFSPNKKVIGGTSGELFRLPVNIASTVTTSVQGSLKNIMFADKTNNSYPATDVTINFTLIEKEEQTLSLTALPEMTEGDAAYTLPAQTSQNLTLTWSVADATIASVSGNMLTPLKAGTTTVTATQAGNNDYLPFTREFTLTVKEQPTQPSVEVTDISQLDNIIFIEPMEEQCGTQAIISLKMKNSAEIRGFQFDLYLPEGVTVVKSSKGKIQGFLSEGRLPDEDEHTLTFSEQSDGAIRFLCSSQYEETFTGNDGEIATLKVNIADNTEDGEYPIQLKNMKLTENNISNFYETALVQSKITISSYILGDINNDGAVDVSDYTGVANHIHNNTPAGFNAKAADVDESGTIDVSDYTGIANIIHTGSIYGNSGNAPALMLSPRMESTDLSGYNNVIYIEPFTASAGTQIDLSFSMKNTAEIRGFQFDLYLPEGMTVAKSNKGRILGALSEGRLPDEDEHDLTFSEQPDGAIRFLCSSQYEETFTGNDGEIATLKVNIAGDMAGGSYSIQMKDMKLTETDISNYYTAELIESTVTIGEVDTRVVLDELSTSIPEATTDAVDIKILRTIKTNEWNTICLPFAMTGAQVTTAFGNDVQLADFIDYEVDDDATQLTVNFDVLDPADGMEANYPYLIKINKPEDITEFTAKSIIEPAEDDAVVEYDNGKTGSRRKVYGTFKGTFHAQTVVPVNCLFISDNKFWYSTGATKMKAYRAYFDFVDILEMVENPSSRVVISFDDNTTGITNTNSTNDTNEWYTVSGVKVEKPVRKGLYINNGHKVVVK